MLRLMSVIALLSLLVTGYVYTSNKTEANVVLLSPDAPCESFRNDMEMYETCEKVWEFDRTHAGVQIVID